MAPIKFEEHIKEQLEKRKIQPSKNSWEKLNTQLDNETGKKSGFESWMYAVAAILLIILASGIFLTQQQEGKEPVIVEQPSEEILEKIEIPADDLQQERGSQIASEENPAKTEAVDKKSIAAENKNVQQGTGSRKYTMKREPIEAIEMTRTKIAQNKVAINESRWENQNLLRVEMSSEEKAETLLAEALSNTRFSNIDTTSIETLTANLLREAEEDLDQSFRREVFELMKGGLVKAKDAIVSRND